MTSGTTSSLRKANFFLAGAPKAGTTSVHRLLHEHPEVFLSPIKEPCHFCTDVAAQIAPAFERQKPFELAAYLDSPKREPVHYYLVRSPDEYARLFEGVAQQKVVGECSTYYLSSRTAAQNIRAYNPDAKIVVLLRNPLQRIRSHYMMDRSLGTATRPLLTLVKEELALGKEAHWGNSQYYLGASRYAQQLEEYYRHFDPANICVLSFERLIAEPERELRRLFAFLGIAVPTGRLTLPLANRSRAVRFPLLNSCLRASGLRPIMAEVLRRTLPERLKHEMRSAYYREGTRVVTDEDLHELGKLLRDEGLYSQWSDALAYVPSLEPDDEDVSREGRIAAA